MEPVAPSPQRESQHEESFLVQGMHCAGCVSRVESALCELPGVEQATVNLASGEVRVRLAPAANAEPDDFRGAIESVGFEYIQTDPRTLQRSALAQRRSNFLKLRSRVIVAAPFAAAVFLLSMFVPDFAGKTGLLCLLTTPVVFWSGGTIFSAALKALRHGGANMDTLIALGSGTAYAVSGSGLIAPGFWNGSPPVYFEASALTIFFVLIGRMLEERAKWQTSSAIDRFD